MTDSKTRINKVLKRAGQLSRQREKRKITAYKLTSITLAVLLVYCISKFPVIYKTATVSDSCGSILLIDEMGGYVLTAVAAFITAVILTLVCQKFKNNKKQ